MGERAGYRVREGEKVSWIARKQWYFGGDKEALESITLDMAKNLLEGNYGGLAKKTPTINSGSVALRHDLGIGRLFASLARAVLQDCFESLEPDEKCDISNHGLFEWELVEWNRWDINHYDACRKVSEEKWVSDELQEKVKLGSVTFEEGKPLKGGALFEWSPDFEKC